MRPLTDPFAATDADLLLVVDVQYDFCPDGALGVAEGDRVVPLVNRLGAVFPHVAMTQDWHPAGHVSFASSHPGKAPFDEIELPYGRQTLWPDHCVQGSPGARFHADLDIPHCALIVRKGFHKHIDSYSAFFENDRTTPTGLAGALSERGFKRIFICGLAYDFCVRFTAEDAAAHGFEAIVVADATRPVNLPGTVAATEASFAERGIREVGTEALIAARNDAAGASQGTAA